jgi:hypothetical protein
MLTTLTEIEGQPMGFCLDGLPRQPRRLGSSNVEAWHYLLSHMSAASRLAASSANFASCVRVNAGFITFLENAGCEATRPPQALILHGDRK